MAPKPALAKTASIAAEALDRGRRHRLDLVPLGDVAAHRERPLLAAELGGELLERLQPPRREHQPVAPAAARAVAAPMPLLAPVIRRTGSSALDSRRFSHSARSGCPGSPDTQREARPPTPAPPPPACDNPPSVDPQRKRKIRLVVALSVAVLLAVALVYTSFSASTEAKEPSELVHAPPGTSYEHDRQGRQGLGPATAAASLRFRVADRDGGGESLPVTYSGIVPDPFRGGREIVLSGEVEHGVFVGERDTLVTKCPSKFTTANDS